MMSNKGKTNSGVVGEGMLSVGTIDVETKGVTENENEGRGSMTPLGKKKNMEGRVEVCLYVIMF